MDIKELERIIGILKANEITEFELVQQDGTHIKLARGTKAVPVAVAAPVAAPVQLATIEPAIGLANGAQVPVQSNGNAEALPKAAEVPSNFIKVESPVVGTFYRKPAPDAEPFVREGDVVKRGDTLCIVEAMKLMNEIDAPSDGKVEKILLSDGEVVEFGEVLFLINPNV
jgi:acetyl-CoA carboxylase biotin carboxyl carrier protein